MLYTDKKKIKKDQKKEKSNKKTEQHAINRICFFREEVHAG